MPVDEIFRLRSKLQKLGFIFVAGFAFGLVSATVLGSSLRATESSDDHTLHVRRGSRTFDVYVSEGRSSVQRHLKVWDGFCQLMARDVEEYVLENQTSVHLDLLITFVARCRPKAVQDFLDDTFTQTRQPEVKQRAARWLQYLDDDRGFRWAVSELELQNTSHSVELLSIVAAWYAWHDSMMSQHETSDRRSLKLTPAVASALDDAFRVAVNETPGDLDSPSPAAIDVLGDAIVGLSDSDARDLLVDFLEQVGGRTAAKKPQVFDRLISEYSRRYCDRWLLDYCVDQAQFQIDDRRRMSESIQRCLNRLCRKSEAELKISAIESYDMLLRQLPTKAAIDAGLFAIENGVLFSHEFLRWYRQRVDSWAESKANFVAVTDQLNHRKPDRFDFVSAEILAAAYSGTQNRRITNSLTNRIWPAPRSADKLANSPGLHKDLLAIDLISDDPPGYESLRLLSRIAIPVVQCEYTTIRNNKSTSDLFKLFHRHDFAMDLDPDEYLELLRQQIIENGELDSCCNGKLVGSRYLFSSYEKICGVFSMLNRETSINGKRSIVNDFWKLADLTDGKFQPSALRIGLNKHSSETTCSFIWRDKTFSFPVSDYSASLIPPLNAILRSEGLDECFVVVQGYPTVKLLDDNSEVVLCGPTEVFDELETEFGLFISVR
ncbi:hypothetical protein MFFC18_30870 [Mariniblastus fucicola]|uniref:Uncharacterized protein n=1 Tax=Mariniblastus fucicola TaxID=980251 RepID=A0A5B9PKK2_9BACT|nr:hypothetical protein MFFC18_30870 [Mariniblastus fucicola]